MTRIKICGITNSEDAYAAIDYGADALGFICVPESPRYVGYFPPNGIYPPNAVWDLTFALPPFVALVAVCRDMTDAANFRGSPVKTIQYYEEPEQEWDEGFYETVWRSYAGTKRLIHAFRMRDESSFEEIAAKIALFRPHAILLDTYHKDKLGGSGETFKWELAVEAKKRFDLPIILAGGLTPDNVEEAIRTVRPYAVDVSSGVEAEPGRKDHARLRAFCEAVRRADS